MIERLAGDGHTERSHAREIRQAALAGLVLLAEDHLLLGAVLRAPGSDPPLQGSPHAGIQLRVPSHQLLEHAERANARTALQDRHDLGLEDIGQGVRPPPAPRLAVPRGDGEVAGKPVAGGPAEARLRSRDVDCVGFLQGHEKPLLAIGDVATRQRYALLLGESPSV